MYLQMNEMSTYIRIIRNLADTIISSNILLTGSSLLSSDQCDMSTELSLWLVAYRSAETDIVHVVHVNQSGWVINGLLISPMLEIAPSEKKLSDG